MYLGVRTRPWRALIVDDELLVALDVETMVRDLGFEECELAASPSHALALAMRGEPDVAFVDVCLEGGEEGIELARRLRQVCSARVVFVTGNTDGRTLQRIDEQVPGAPVVSKPVRPEGLAQALAVA
jgi:two-component system, response regulator PdtaR